MNFLADESCAGPVIWALREAGHDVVAVAEVASGAADEQVMNQALGERRILITEDRDFGELVYARGAFLGRSHPGEVPQPCAPGKTHNGRRGGGEARHAPFGRFCGNRTRTGAHRQPAPKLILERVHVVTTSLAAGSQAGGYGQVSSDRGLFSGPISDWQCYVINLHRARCHRGRGRGKIVVA